MAEAELGLHALSAGIDKVPDTAFDRVPGFRPPKEQRRKSKQAKKDERYGSRYDSPAADAQNMSDQYYPSRDDYGRRSYNPTDYQPREGFSGGGGGRDQYLVSFVLNPSCFHLNFPFVAVVAPSG